MYLLYVMILILYLKHFCGKVHYCYKNQNIHMCCFRFNLDPFESCSDDAIWEALEKTKLRDRISNINGQLQAYVGQGRESLSVGERQLLCLARALLRNTKVRYKCYHYVTPRSRVLEKLMATLMNKTFPWLSFNGKVHCISNGAHHWTLLLTLFQRIHAGSQLCTMLSCSTSKLEDHPLLAAIAYLCCLQLPSILRG